MGGGEGGGREGPGESERQREAEREMRGERDGERTRSRITAGKRETGRDRQGRTDKRGGDRQTDDLLGQGGCRPGARPRPQGHRAPGAALQPPSAVGAGEEPLTFVWPGLGCARRRASHFGGQPIHIPQVGQNALEFHPPAFCRDAAMGRSHPGWTRPCTGDSFPASGSHCRAEAGKPCPRVHCGQGGMGDGQGKTPAGSLGSPPGRSLSLWLRSVTPRASELRPRARGRRSAAPTALPRWSPSCFLSEACQALATRAQRAGGPASGRAGPACTPTGIFPGRGAGRAAAAQASCSPWAALLRKCVRPAETLGQDAAAGGRVCPYHPP